ncbi:hypothetical protein [Aquirufa rosea]|uniref:Uncharacterized protein n=1 Tax=Aquirufa rosea TaxID=2509241 RepID=A0A4Q1BXT1_9BACT|nr:hypothetical protein [Aquirufa rosea]RXK47516.1 hypothetical protein ESB04_09755 [Aquirufa rosea]
MAVNPTNFFDDLSLFFKEIELSVEYREELFGRTYFLPSLAIQMHAISLSAFQGMKQELDEIAWQELMWSVWDKSNERICLWEDIWVKRQDWVKTYFLHRKQGIKSIFARDLRVIPLKKDQVNNFLDQEHLLGAIKAKYYLGLVVPLHRQFRNITSDYVIEGQKLVGVAAFSKPIIMNEAGLEGQRSGELIRYCSIQGSRIVGGLSKVIQSYLTLEKVDNLMTYIDLEWNRGNGYQSIGFQQVQITPPILFQLDAKANRAITSSWDSADVCTLGNLKLRKYFS